ncbi:prepilin peptidase [Sphingosinicella sp. LHD-64]|uniref:A24 family peptidase n=1 Tax=Sphingosinicella sp. LHD-64 TaxID=3072139 RepID=UPI0028108048|nr:prepilin peptidase [Sphingosinicella sp. LHD-64]MDQ8755390.1 prepilin peptidase [Sphingosinicella sp. LHD-64]
MSTILPWGLLALLAALLLVATWTDLRSRTIPNWLNLAIAVLAVPFWWASNLPLWPDAVLQIGVALLIFSLFAGVFALGAMGGGDVKMIGALALWLPWQALLVMLVIMSIAGGVLTVALLIRRKLARSETPIEVPYGVAIAFGGLWVIAPVLSERILYQFG